MRQDREGARQKSSWAGKEKGGKRRARKEKTFFRGGFSGWGTAEKTTAGDLLSPLVGGGPKKC